MMTRILFQDGSEIESADLSPGQRLMIEDGFPTGAIIPAEERAVAWKGRKLTKPRDLKTPVKDEDAATKQLRKELEAAEAKKKSERLARLKELSAQKRDQAMKTKTETTGSKAEQVKALRERRAVAKGTKVPAPKKAKTAKASTKAKKVRTVAAGSAGDVRPGSKLELIVGLLTRKEGCTTQDALDATGWPTLSFNQQAKAAGIKLRKVKEGRITRYFAD